MPSFVDEKVDPSTHREHTRSAVSEPSCDSPWPAGHTCHCVHAWLPETDVNEPEAQVLHWRSDDAPNATVSYWPGAHTVMAWHTRSAVAVGAANVYCLAGHTARCVVHSRSDVVDGVAVSNSLPVHTVTGVQAAPSLAPDHVESAVHGVH